MSEPCWNCGTEIEQVGLGAIQTVGRHKAPCGAICGSGWGINVPEGESRYPREEDLHIRPWEGPALTDGHYHGTCPNGCFKDCCNPKGNLCGEECQKCFPKNDD